MQYNRSGYNISPFNRGESEPLQGFVWITSHSSLIAQAQVLISGKSTQTSVFSLQAHGQRVLSEEFTVSSLFSLDVIYQKAYNALIELTSQFTFTHEAIRVRNADVETTSISRLEQYPVRVRTGVPEIMYEVTSLFAEPRIIYQAGNFLHVETSLSLRPKRILSGLATLSVQTSCGGKMGSIVTGSLAGREIRTNRFFNRMAFNRWEYLELMEGIAAESSLQARGVLLANARTNLHTTGTLNAKGLRVQNDTSEMYAEFSALLVGRRAFSGRTFPHSYFSISLIGQPTYTDAVNLPTREFHSYVEIYLWPGQPPLIVDVDDMGSFDLLEEVKYDTMSPIGGISSNSFNLILTDVLHNFNPGNPVSPYAGLLLPRVKIIPYIGMLFNGEMLYEELGTYYVEDWKARHDFPTVEIPCKDRLNYEGALPIPATKVIKDTTLNWLFGYVFQLAGIPSTDYVIDLDLNIPITYAWLPQGTLIQVLDYLAQACGAYVYVDRKNKYQVKAIKEGINQVKITETDQIITYENDASYSNLYSGVSMNYYKPTSDISQEVLRLTDVPLQIGDNVLEDFKFTKSPVMQIDSIRILNAPAARLQYYKAGTEKISMTIYSPTVDNVDILVMGRPILENPQTTVLDNLTIQNIIGVRRLEVDNYLVQDKVAGQWYQQKLLNLCSNPSAPVRTTIRGNPRITINRYLLASDYTQKITEQRFLTTRSRMIFDGGLSMMLEGIRV